MTSALDRFETSLVDASRAFQGRAITTEACDGAAAPVAERGARPPRTGLRRRGWRVLGGAVAVGALVAAGTTLVGPTGNPKYITQFECGAGAHGGVHELVTAEPVAACAALWPSIYHRAAPALAAWVYETGGAVVVRPVGDPPGGPGATGWKRLPAGWVADRGTVELNDQLEDITTGLPSRPCWTASSASRLASAFLRRDGLASWRVRVSRQHPSRDATGACLSVIQALGGPEVEPQTILLVERAVRPPAPGASWYPNRFGGRRRAIETRVNRALRAGGRCATLAAAAALWRAEAAAGGLPADQYVLDTPATASPAGKATCARIFVSEPGGGGPSDVYPADLP
jgi:hypothetical protein